MTMAWLDLLFAHWPLEPGVLRPLLPPHLPLDTYDGRAWISLVPFRMESVGPRGFQALPARLGGPRSFPELNVRTYVRHGGKAGVFFFSLDATSPLAIWAARRFFHLPYFRARIETEERDGWIYYESTRTDPLLGPGEFRGRYRGLGERLSVLPGSLEYWLTERYCLFAATPEGRILRGDIHHLPWPLEAAEAEIEHNTAVEAHGLQLTGDPLCHFARQLPVVAWWPTPSAADSVG
jgi:hypothetical protein